MRYKDKKGRTIYVGTGLGGNKFMVLYTKGEDNGSHRLKSPALPIRETLAESEADLAAYAEKHSWTVSNEDELDILTHEIILYKNRTAKNFIEIGKRLKMAKEKLEHGQWLAWLRDKVEFSRGMAARLIQCADEFGNVPPAEHLSLSKMFELLSLPAEKRDKFLKNNDVKEMTKRQLRQAVKKAKQADKITTTATIETLPDEANQSTSTDLSETSTDAKIDVQPVSNIPIIDETYSNTLIEKIKEGYISYKNAAEIARDFPGDEEQQISEMQQRNMAYQQSLAEIPEEDRPANAFCTRHIYAQSWGTATAEIDVYTALIDNKYYFAGAMQWTKRSSQDGKAVNGHLDSFIPGYWSKHFNTEDSAEAHGLSIAIKAFGGGEIRADKSSQFSFEITPEIAEKVKKSTPAEAMLYTEPIIEPIRQNIEKKLSNSMRVYSHNKSAKGQIYTAFYTMLVNYMQNIDDEKIIKFMEEHHG